MWAGVDPGSPLQVFNAVVNVLFAVDIILNFFIPFRMPETGYEFIPCEVNPNRTHV